jgi:hypothetical protein
LEPGSKAELEVSPPRSDEMVDSPTPPSYVTDFLVGSAGEPEIPKLKQGDIGPLRDYWMPAFAGMPP